ncbi:PucR family transcriptional regulator [Citricoccus sp. SGAir0253]|uniref:PucR family transcriptional regulator n=1 Tax=Citricoccus sp. SGAir0253 TaxID=2567881 RepID=UPI0010CCB9A0|nr:helix-turn-helix domain-containing protein [Citricoccus sp. SGAir0253]QCU78468.1 PucR family transcriptional regulator [Citricoccus sp. SGAir0253]
MEREALRALVDALAADDAILEETVAALRESLPGYEGVPSESLLASARRNRALSIRTLLDGRAPAPDEIDEPRALMEERMGQGVPIVSVLAGFRVSMSVILRHLLDLAPAFGVPADAALTFSTQLWALGDAFTTRAVVVYRDRSIAQAVADSARRTQWIRDAMVGVLDQAQLRSGAATFDIPLAGPVRAVRAAVAAGDTEDPAGRLQDWAASAGARALAAPRGEGAVGILVGDAGPARPAAGVTIAVGPPVALADLRDSFEGATRVLEAARRVGWDGVVDVERLSWRMAIPASPETTRMLHERHVEPVLAEGAFGGLVLEALEAYLDHGMSIPLAAAAIPVHVNTLRYRLKRYEELTGASLQQPETLIEASWALAAQRGLRRGAPERLS